MIQQSNPYCKRIFKLAMQQEAQPFQTPFQGVVEA